MTWYGMVWYGMAWYGTVWYGRYGDPLRCVAILFILFIL